MRTSLQDINPRVKAIRDLPSNALRARALQITQELTRGVPKAFTRVVDVCSLDPHQAGVQPISFLHQVLAVCVYPEFLSDEDFALDVRQRARRLLQACSGSSVGSYSPLWGLDYITQHSVTEFITSRDAGVPTDGNNIFTTSGSQRGLMTMLRLLSSVEGEPQNGLLVPLPSPHTLAMVLDHTGIRPVPYRLREDAGWAVDLEELQCAIRTARGCCRPMAIYISNPGNPTGYIQNRKSIEEVIKFAAAEGLFLLVDEVDQHSVHGSGMEFVSYKKVLFEMGPGYWDTVEMASFHSLSNGFIGECGLRGGYMELLNMDREVMSSVRAFANVDISSPILGQLALDIMFHPPRPSEPSYAVYTQEILANQTTLAENARRARDFLDSLPGMSCQPAVGGVYVYPCVDIPSGVLERAKEEQVVRADMLALLLSVCAGGWFNLWALIGQCPAGVQPHPAPESNQSDSGQAAGVEADVLYCQDLLEEQGVCVGAGSENGHTGGDYHLRLCVAASTVLLEEALERLGAFHLRLLDSHRC